MVNETVSPHFKVEIQLGFKFMKVAPVNEIVRRAGKVSFGTDLQILGFQVKSLIAHSSLSVSRYGTSLEKKRFGCGSEEAYTVSNATEVHRERCGVKFAEIKAIFSCSSMVDCFLELLNT